jgi:hypothetical protein
MSRLRKYGGIALLLFSLVIVAQIGVSFLVKTHRMRGYLIAHLESAFGRPVQAGDFSIQILPMPQLDVDAVTIGEDAAFGSEYFLRAERLSASVRWGGLLRRRFEFGTMLLTRPSLVLVRNASGRWNLEGWLPPAGAKADGGSVAGGAPGPQQRPEATHHLQKIEFDGGRINFKIGDDKRPFAFIDVSGSVEQVSTGRWQLQLKARPWRSGVTLQSTGTLQVAGDLAGTSARLRPAQFRLHWDKVSLADMFRLITGNDSGVRGEFALDGNASVGLGSPTSEAEASEWRFELQARAAGIHRWDLIERSDNPRVNVHVKGFWDLAAGQVRAEDLRVELPGSNLSGAAVLQTGAPFSWQAQFKDMNVQAGDLLVWYRAFQPGMSDNVTLEDSIKGSLTASGWPLKWDQGAIAGSGGTLRAPGMSPAQIEPFHGSVRNGKFSLASLRLRFAPELFLQASSDKNALRPRPVAVPESLIEASFVHDTVARQGGLRLNLHLANTAPLFVLAAATGHPLNQGWEFDGGASGLVTRDWGGSLKDFRRGGSLDLTKAQLQVAGLNQPLRIGEARLEWKDDRRSATIAKAEAFGAVWSGTISEADDRTPSAGTSWRFQLHADRLDATELDRWFGPRARPNWLQRLLSSLLGGSNTAGRASELLRKVSAEGELTVDSLVVEKIKLSNLRGKVSLRDLQLQVADVETQWAGGTVRGGMQAKFSPLPEYEITAEFARVNLAELPWPPRWAERWGGAASGKAHLTTGGVGREELLRQLAGQADVKLEKIELRGWDAQSSAETGTLRSGVSSWTSGQGNFELSGQMFRFDAIQLDSPRQRTQLAGTLGFDMSSNLTFRVVPGGKRSIKNLPATRELSLSGPLEAPEVTVQPVNTGKKQP